MTVKKHIAGAMRTLAVVLIHASEALDPQPDVTGIWPFEVHTTTGTQAHEAHITWHRTA